MRITLAAVLALAALTHAQTNRGAITGTVFDATGAVVPGAKVVVTNVGTNEVHRVSTSDSGDYTVQDLEPVEYKISVEATGFSMAVAERVKVDTAATSTVNFRLQPGNIKVEVTVVSAGAPLLNVESGTSGQTITEMQFVNAPLANRSVLDLALTVPNVTGDVGTEDPGVGSGGTQPGYNMTINGGRAGSSLMLADGVNNTGVGLARAVVSFSPETVQEMSVQTNAYSAEFGRTGGGVINVTTKSGTNQLHGTALWYGRNPWLNAAPYTLASTNRSPSTLRDNEFSLAVGGPVYIPKLYNGRNRTFFFFAVEPRYRTDHVQVDGLMANDATRGGDFSNTVLATNSASVAVPASVAAQFPSVKTSTSVIYQAFTPSGTQLTAIAAPSGGTLTPFPNNVLPPTLLDPVDVQMLQYIPKPNTGYYIDPSGNLANYVTQRFLQDDNTRYTARIDENVSDAEPPEPARHHRADCRQDRLQRRLPRQRQRGQLQRFETVHGGRHADDLGHRDQRFAVELYPRALQQYVRSAMGRENRRQPEHHVRASQPDPWRAAGHYGRVGDLRPDRRGRLDSGRRRGRAVQPGRYRDAQPREDEFQDRRGRDPRAAEHHQLPVLGRRHVQFLGE